MDKEDELELEVAMMQGMPRIVNECVDFLNRVGWMEVGLHFVSRRLKQNLLYRSWNHRDRLIREGPMTFEEIVTWLAPVRRRLILKLYQDLWESLNTHRPVQGIYL